MGSVKEGCSNRSFVGKGVMRIEVKILVTETNCEQRSTLLLRVMLHKIITGNYEQRLLVLWCLLYAVA